MDEGIKDLNNKQLWDKVSPLFLNQLEPEEIAELSSQSLKDYIDKVVLQINRQYKIALSPAQQDYIKLQLYNEAVGFGPIEPLFHDDEVTDILINDLNEVYVERLGKLELTNITFRDSAHITHLLMRALANTGRRIDTSKPYVDAVLTDGSRLNAVMPPLVNKGPVVSIRKFNYKRFSLEKLIENEFISKEAGQYLKMATLTHLNMIIIGGAGSGKTTLLNALLNEIQTAERALIIEDTSEIKLNNKHAIQLQTRLPNIEGIGEITQRDLLRNSLRMRPDRIIIGEIRGGEVLEMFQAMNTGYDGSLSTVHASRIEELPFRLANMSAMTGLALPIDFIYSQIAACIHVVAQIVRFHDGKRRIVAIKEVAGMKDGQLQFNDIYSYQYNNERKNYTEQFFPDRSLHLSEERLRRYGLEPSHMMGKPL